MSGLVGPDGKTPIQSDLPVKEFRAGGLQFSTSMTPDMLLTKAVQGAQQAIAQQTYQAVIQRLTASPLVTQSQAHTQATAEAQSAASKVGDPFTLEPAGMAVFMYLAREIQYRDAIIEQVNERLQKLGADPLDMTHPYPVPEPPEESEESEGEDDGDSDADEGGEDETPPPVSTLAN